MALGVPVKVIVTEFPLQISDGAEILAVGLVTTFIVIDCDKLCDQLVVDPEEILIKSICCAVITFGITTAA